MSFSRESKLEILSQTFDDDCAIAFLSGLFHASGEIGKDCNGFFVTVSTDILELFDFCQNMVSRLYGQNVRLRQGETYTISKNKYYEIIFPPSTSHQLLIDTGYIKSGDAIDLDINECVFQDDELKKAFIKGVYVAISTSNIKISSDISKSAGTGYHLEFASHNHNLLLTLSSILAEFEILGKIISRGELFVFYIKDVSTISSLLALVGADSSMLNLSSEVVARQMRNKANREVNCINANINKTIDASMRQIDDINLISQTIGIESLPLDLQDVALLRLANPDESLEDLIKISGKKISKSGLNHRFKKIQKIAKELK